MESYLHKLHVMTAAHVDAAGSSSFKHCYIFVLICYFFPFIAEADITDDRNTLTDIEKGNTGIDLKAADLGTIIGCVIF